MRRNLGFLVSSNISLGKEEDNNGKASLLGNPIFTFGGDTIKIRDNIYELGDKIRKA